MIPRYNAPRPKGSRTFACTAALPPPQLGPWGGSSYVHRNLDSPCSREPNKHSWGRLGHWHHHYGVVIPATPLPVSREILTTSETLHPTLKLAAKYD